MSLRIIASWLCLNAQTEKRDKALGLRKVEVGKKTPALSHDPQRAAPRGKKAEKVPLTSLEGNQKAWCQAGSGWRRTCSPKKSKPLVCTSGGLRAQIGTLPLLPKSVMERIFQNLKGCCRRQSKNTPSRETHPQPYKHRTATKINITFF